MSDKIQLLLIEDSEPDSRMFMELMKEVKSNPIQVNHVKDMANGVTRFLQKPPIDLIVTDLSLGDTNGLDVVETLTKLANVPIIVLTSYDQHGMVFKAMELGAYDYFIKGELNSRWIFHVLLRAFHEKGKKFQKAEQANQQKYLIDQASDDLKRAIENLNKIQETLTKIEMELTIPMEKVKEQVSQSIAKTSQLLPKP